MRRAILLHGWEESPSGHWFTWLRETLESNGWLVQAPELPNTMKPKLNEWMDTLQALVPDKSTVLIGHSLANALILKYLELPKTTIKGAVLVAAWDWLMEDVREFHETFFEPGFDYEAIKNKNAALIMINSTNDPWIDFEKSKQLANKINAKFVPALSAGHFRTKDGYAEFPKLVEVMETTFK